MERNAREFGYIHQHSIHHRSLLEQSDRCGCFYCEKIYSPSEVEEWIDEQDDSDPDSGVTALCPYCGIDAVLPSAAGIDLTPALLTAMHRHYF
jgi:wobble nucleotide-excising tRNase